MSEYLLCAGHCTLSTQTESCQPLKLQNTKCIYFYYGLQPKSRLSFKNMVFKKPIILDKLKKKKRQENEWNLVVLLFHFQTFDRDIIQEILFFTIRTTVAQAKWARGSWHLSPLLTVTNNAEGKTYWRSI